MRRIVDNRYVVLEPLGGGGVGEVFLARDEVLGREVALKVLSRRYAGDEEFIERFKREARSTALLSHPNIVAVYDLGETGQSVEDNSVRESAETSPVDTSSETQEYTLYITMEYVPGITLADLIGQGALPPMTAAAIALGASHGLEKAHQYGIVHRDVKPHNVLLGKLPDETHETLARKLATEAFVSGSATVKLTDFGIARRLAESTLTERNAIMGTALYLSPEQAVGGSVDHRSDLYSLGVVLYEMLTGQRPFEAGDEESPLTLAMKHVTELPKPPTEIEPSIPAALESITLRLLAKVPEERPNSAMILARELQEIAQVVRQDLHQTSSPRPSIQSIESGRTEMAADPSSTVPFGRENSSIESQTVRMQRAEAQESTTVTSEGTGVRTVDHKRKWPVLLAVVFLVSGLLLVAAGMRDAGPFSATELQKVQSGTNSREIGPSGDESSANTTSPSQETPSAQSASAELKNSIEQATTDYYMAVDREDWAYTYNNLDSANQEMFTSEEWYQKNQWFADNERLKLASIDVEVTKFSSNDSSAQVRVSRTFKDGTMLDRDTVFVKEDSMWKHRLVGRELIFFMPDANYDQFVETKQDN